MPDDTQSLSLQDLLGRRVIARNGRSIGRIVEFRAERAGRGYEIREIVIGTGGWLERLSIADVIGRDARALVARWDQIDVSDPSRPRLTCAADELQHG